METPEPNFPRCATCRYWGFANPKDNDRPAVEGVPVKRICRAVQFWDGDRPEHDDVPDFSSQAYVTDGSGYTATLWTAETFGCVLFETKEGE